MEMSERIKMKRLEYGFTQEELAEKLGIQKSAVAKYENGRTVNIKRSVIAKMAEIFECSPCYLMALDKEECVIDKNSYEYAIIVEVQKMNLKGKIKTLESVKEMVCNPLYNENYKFEVKAAHERADIEVTDEMRRLDDDLMDGEW